MPTEVEARFRAESAEPLVELAGRARLGPARLGPPRTVHETDRYLDTVDGRLAAARWACRLRSREGTTRISLKGPPTETAHGWHHRRHEVEGPATPAIDPGSWPASEALDLLETLSAGLPLGERLRLDQARTERIVYLDGGAAIGTLTLDHARISADTTDLGELFVVEFELLTDSVAGERELQHLATALEATDGLVAEPRSKLERALERLAERR